MKRRTQIGELESYTGRSTDCAEGPGDREEDAEESRMASWMALDSS